MRNTILFLAIAAIILGYSSCKDTIEDVIDCSVESVFLSVDANVDGANPLLVHFTFINGDTIDNKFTLDQTIMWEFGDGNQETSQGLQISHQYPDAATYNVKAHYTLRRGSSDCTSYKEKSVTVQ